MGERKKYIVPTKNIDLSAYLFFASSSFAMSHVWE